MRRARLGKTDGIARIVCVCAASAIALLPGVADGAAGPKAVFAVVVGVNDVANGSAQPRLEYADDDAIRNYHVMTMLGADAVLLTTVDASTRDRYAAVFFDPPDGGAPEEGAAMIPVPKAATLPNFRATLREVFDRIKLAQQQGRETELFFWYSGHGVRRGASASIVFDGGELFSRAQLYEELLNRTPADFNHLFIDACEAEWFVDRPSVAVEHQDPPARERLLSYMDGQTLARHPNVGVLFAATKDRRVHEWSTYEGGVFSFELRSALLNAADADGDNRVTYIELLAFLAAANQKVAPAVKLHVADRIPKGEAKRVMADWTGVSRSATVRLAVGTARHVRIVDGKGTALLETNKDARDAVRLILPRAPEYAVVVLPDRGSGREERFAFRGTSHDVELESVLRDSARAVVSARGDLADALHEGLFREPYGYDYYRKFQKADARERGDVNNLESPPEEPASHWLRWGYGLIAGAAIAAGVAAASWYVAGETYEEYTRAAEADKPRLETATRRWDWATTLSLGAAAVAGLSGATLLVLSYRPRGTAGEATLAAGVSLRF